MLKQPLGRRDQHVATRALSVIGQGAAFELGERAARLGQYHVCGGDVPIPSVRRGDRKIVGARRDIGQPQRQRRGAWRDLEPERRLFEETGEAARRYDAGARQRASGGDADCDAVEESPRPASAVNVRSSAGA